jgi:type IX secretion system PorP/SprF family membrane protein
MKKIIWVGVLFYCFTAKAQDIHFSQFFETMPLRNPALSGLFNGDFKATMAFKDQWNSITQAYKTGYASTELKMPMRGNDFVTFGINLVYDKSGSIDLSTLHAMPTINYHKSVSQDRSNFLNIGFSAGMYQRSFNPSKITTNSQFIGGQYVATALTGENFNTANYRSLDVTAGISFNGQITDKPIDRIFVGAALHHVTKPKVSFYYNNSNSYLNNKWVANAGLRMGLSDVGHFTVQADHAIQGPYNETLIGALYSHNLSSDKEIQDNFITLGAMMRWKDAIIPVIKLDFAPLSLGFSYDVNTSTLRNASFGRGGFEVTLSYTAWRRVLTDEEVRIRCPRF